MKIKILLLTLAVAVSILITQIEGRTEPESSNTEPIIEQKNIENMTYLEMIQDIAPKFNQNPKLLAQIVYNESNFKVQCHDSCRAKNITAIHDTTFKSWLPKYQKETGETLDIHSQYDSLKLMAWAFSKGESYRDDWSTYVACTSPNLTYSFYSSLMQRHYTVTCKSLPSQYII